MESERVIRILQVGMSPYYGGTESFLMSQYRAIDKSKVQFDFLNVYNEKIACQDEIESMGGRIYYLDMARHHGLKSYYKNMDAFFEKNAHQFGAVHCNYQSLINIDILKYAKKYGIKIRIAHAHNSGYGTVPSEKQKLLIFMNRISIRRYATHFFACSSLAAEWMFGKCAIIIKNAIDSEKYLYSKEKRKEVRKQLDVEGDFVIMFAGRLDPQKNPLFMLDIFCEVRKLKSEAKLLVVGDGILHEEMVARIEALGIGDSVELLGSRNDVNELLQAADVFLLPSKFEGLGIVLIEAQAAGLKCFTSKTVVPKDVDITGLVEFVSLEDNASVWANKIIQVEKIERVNCFDAIREAGYDSASSIQFLENVYFS